MEQLSAVLDITAAIGAIIGLAVPVYLAACLLVRALVPRAPETVPRAIVHRR